MRKILIVLAFIFAIIAIVFAILPLGTLGLLPVGLSLIFGGLAFFTSDTVNRTVPKWLLIIAALTLVVIVARSFVPDEVAKDTKFEQKKAESKQEDLKDLEGLE
jgi:membrane protein implicated in regulation of membrane protease activity